MKQLFFLTSIICACGAISVFAQTDSFSVFFAYGKYQMGATQKARLDSFLQTGKLQQAPSVLIMGYGDKAGGMEVNLKLSQLRADGIRKYLIAAQIEPSRILSTTGLGIRNPQSEKDTTTADRRVNILLMRVPLDNNMAKTLSHLEVGQTLVLKNINFVNGAHSLEQSSYSDLEQLYLIMLLSPTLKVRIEGHICCWFSQPGDDDDHTYPRDTITYRPSTLSLNRAKFICNYLISKGIDSSRLAYTGFGNTKPLVFPERSDGDRKQNRRVEVRVLAK